MSWIFCQVGAREHYAVARALHRQQKLELLVTDMWLRAGNPLGRLKSRLRARFHLDLATANVFAPNFRSAVFELGAYCTGVRDWARIIARNEWFQNVGVERLSRIKCTNRPRTLVAYSYAALELFKFAHARGWRTVLGQIDAGSQEERIVAKLYNENSSLNSNWQPAPPEYWSRWQEECALADRIVVNSMWSHAALVAQGVPAARIRMVPLAYEPPQAASTFRRTYPAAFTPSRPLRALFLGQINLRKGAGPLLEAIRSLRGEPVEFVVVGPLQISIPRDLRDDPQVRWLGPVSREGTSRFYREADVFLFPTFSDGFGLTQLEAQAWKLPVIATRFCGDVVEDGRNGMLLSELNPCAIATTIRQCLRDPLLLQKFSANSEVAERFDLAHVGEQWLHIFE
jgi:glycosyltransferase involved in cell wall biosynthesis